MSNESDKELYAAFEHGAESRESEIESLHQQLSDHIKREVMLLDALKEIRDDFDCDSDSHKYGTTCRSCLAREALAVTADLDGLILCEKKPFARKISYGSLVFLEGYAELSEGTSLYRAWEPKT